VEARKIDQEQGGAGQLSKEEQAYKKKQSRQMQEEEVNRIKIFCSSSASTPQQKVQSNHKMQDISGSRRRSYRSATGRNQ
jgi:hypothetical protein